MTASKGFVEVAYRHFSESGWNGLRFLTTTKTAIHNSISGNNQAS